MVVEVGEMVALGSEIARVRWPEQGRQSHLVYRARPEIPQLFVVPASGQIVAVGSLMGLQDVRLTVQGLERAGRSLSVRVKVKVRRGSAAAAAGRGEGRVGSRAARSAPQPLSHTVTVSRDSEVGSIIYTLPDPGRWFQLVSPVDAPVQVERDSGKVYLSRRLLAESPVHVSIRVNSETGKRTRRHLCFSGTRYCYTVLCYTVMIATL